MKKLFLICCLVVLFSSAGLAEERISIDETRRAQDFIPGKCFIMNAFVCDSSDTACIAPITGVPNTPILHIAFYSPIFQIYDRYYIVTDVAGTVVASIYNSTTLEADSLYFFNTPVYLPTGDYIFTFIAAGRTNGAAVSNQYHFAVR